MFKFRLRATQFARGLRVWLIPFLRPAGHLASPLRPPLLLLPASPASPPRISRHRISHSEAGLLTSCTFRAYGPYGNARHTPLYFSRRALTWFPLNWRVLFALCYVGSFTHGDFSIARPAKRDKKEVGVQMEIRIAFVA